VEIASKSTKKSYLLMLKQKFSNVFCHPPLGSREIIFAHFTGQLSKDFEKNGRKFVSFCGFGGDSVQKYEKVLSFNVNLNFQYNYCRPTLGSSRIIFAYSLVCYPKIPNFFSTIRTFHGFGGDSVGKYEKVHGKRKETLCEINKSQTYKVRDLIRMGLTSVTASREVINREPFLVMGSHADVVMKTLMKRLEKVVLLCEGVVAYYIIIRPFRI